MVKPSIPLSSVLAFIVYVTTNLLCGVHHVDSFTLKNSPKPQAYFYHINRQHQVDTSSCYTSTALSLFNFGPTSSSGSAAKIPSSIADRDNQAINGIKAAIKKPRNIPLIECEFPALGALNKLGDGSLRSTLEAEEVSYFNEKLSRFFDVYICSDCYSSLSFFIPHIRLSNVLLFLFCLIL